LDSIIENLFDPTNAIWQWIESDLALQNGVILRAGVSLFTAGIGAYFGAVFAYRNANRLQRRMEKRELSSSLSKALNLSIALTNIALSLKRQSIHGIATRYENNRKEVIGELGRPTVQKTLYVDFDFQYLSAFDIPAKELVDAVIGASPGSDIIQQSIALEQTTQNLSQLLTKRNEILLEFEKLNIPEGDLVRRYFGLQLHDGTKDERYFHVMTNLGATVDDFIFHSYLLYKRLLSEALSRRRSSLRSRDAVGIQLPIADFSDRAAELFPTNDEYQAWLRPAEKMEQSRFESNRKYLRRLEERISALP
jgi:hypothetical protein